jgi:transposase-like protein
MVSTHSDDSAVPLPQVQNIKVTMDTRGRIRASKEQRRLILAEFERSGGSAAQFAKVAGLKYSTFAAWVQRHRRCQPSKLARQVRLLEATVDQTASIEDAKSSGVVLRLVGGAEIQITDSKQIPMAAALVRAVARPC